MKDSQRWQAVCNRDTRGDGIFWYGVLTTGVYCRPSCAARRAKRENVRFYDSTSAAERDGLRPCKRCHPSADQSKGATLDELLSLCRSIERHPADSHSLTALARRASLSQFQIHRLFKSFLGLTPREYVEQVKLNALKKRLRESSTVTDAIYDAGLESSSALYGRLDAHLGMTPRTYRQGGAGANISFAFGATPLGKVLIGATDRGVCFLQFGDSERELLEQLSREYPRAVVTPSTQQSDRQLERWMRALNARLSGGRDSLQLPLDVQGTAFQKRVWEFLRTIPSGDVLSYSEVAAAVGSPKAVRAAANACAGNRIGVLIPCHRVIRGDGGLGGYRWGLERKRALLDLERRGRKGDEQ